MPDAERADVATRVTYGVLSDNIKRLRKQRDRLEGDLVTEADLLRTTAEVLVELMTGVEGARLGHRFSTKEKHQYRAKQRQVLRDKLFAEDPAMQEFYSDYKGVSIRPSQRLPNAHALAVRSEPHQPWARCTAVLHQTTCVVVCVCRGGHGVVVRRAHVGLCGLGEVTH